MGDLDFPAASFWEEGNGGWNTVSVVKYGRCDNPIAQCASKLHSSRSSIKTYVDNIKLRLRRFQWQNKLHVATSFSYQIICCVASRYLPCVGVSQLKILQQLSRWTVKVKSLRNSITSGSPQHKLLQVLISRLSNSHWNFSCRRKFFYWPIDWH